MSEGPYSQLDVGEALWSLALISLSKKQNIFKYHLKKYILIHDTSFTSGLTFPSDGRTQRFD